MLVPCAAEPCRNLGRPATGPLPVERGERPDSGIRARPGDADGERVRIRAEELRARPPLGLRIVEMDDDGTRRRGLECDRIHRVEQEPAEQLDGAVDPGPRQLRTHRVRRDLRQSGQRQAFEGSHPSGG